jgi:DNA polymerase-3 subunit gamma/tau
MTNLNLPNKYRPKNFCSVLGQDSEVKILRQIATKDWLPNAILISGPFGTGKTTLARLLARSLFCSDRKKDSQGVLCEPCGGCRSCKSMDSLNHPNYREVDSASHGSVADIRSLKGDLAYRSGSTGVIIVLDECHQLTSAAQNSLLQILEEGSSKDVLFIFATTAKDKMLPTILSRCINLNMRLLTPTQVSTRLQQVCGLEGIKHTGSALKLIASYIKGHMRDALMLLEQLSNTTDIITEDIVRTYLRLDKDIEIYKFLSESDVKTNLQTLEALLCTYHSSELLKCLVTILVEAFKVSKGLPAATEVDSVWLKKVATTRGEDNLLNMAESLLLKSNSPVSFIQEGIAVIGGVLFRHKAVEVSVQQNSSDFRRKKSSC